MEIPKPNTEATNSLNWELTDIQHEMLPNIHKSQEASNNLNQTFTQAQSKWVDTA